MEGASKGLEERYQFFQEMRGYVRDLVECLNEKVGEHGWYAAMLICYWSEWGGGVAGNVGFSMMGLFASI